MDRRSFVTGAAASALAVSAHGQEPDEADARFARFIGEWGGVIDAGPQRLRIRFVIERADDGPRIRAYSIDQSEEPMIGEHIQLDGDELRVRFPQVRGSYRGALVEPDRIEGTWRQGQSIELNLERDADFDALAIAQPAEPLSQERLEALRAEAGAPGMAAAARGPGGEISFVTGLRSAADDALIGASDLWHLGSITKSMTATLVARLAEAGAINWEQTVAETLPDLAEGAPEAYRGATFLHLLSHRAGLQANLPVMRLLQYPREEEDARVSREDYVRRVMAQEPAGPREETFLYSNSGYVIAGVMLERALDATWEALIAEHVFAPLGLTSAGIGAPGTPGALDQPLGHAMGLAGRFGLGARRTPARLGAGPTDNPAVLGPAGRVHMTMADVLNYLDAHRLQTSFLRRESWERLHRPPYGGDYALGWTVRGDGLWHNGSNTLWYAEVMFSRARELVAAAGANDGALAQTARPVSHALASAAAAVES